MVKDNIKDLDGFKEEIKDVEEQPMDDQDIRFYLPDAKILKYTDLKNYNDINQLLPEPIDYVILLYLDAPNKGHWTALLKYHKFIEFFDPYGLKPDSELKWVDCNTRIKLGTVIPFITRLFNKVKDNQIVVYNPFKYQKEKSDINTCGRHCVYRILKMIDYKMNLEQYYKHMQFLKKKYKISFDEIVSTMIHE